MDADSVASTAASQHMAGDTTIEEQLAMERAGSGAGVPACLAVATTRIDAVVALVALPPAVGASAPTRRLA
jgi:hypothetical protein